MGFLLPFWIIFLSSLACDTCDAFYVQQRQQGGGGGGGAVFSFHRQQQQPQQRRRRWNSSPKNHVTPLRSMPVQAGRCTKNNSKNDDHVDGDVVNEWVSRNGNVQADAMRIGDDDDGDDDGRVKQRGPSSPRRTTLVGGSATTAAAATTTTTTTTTAAMRRTAAASLILAVATMSLSPSHVSASAAAATVEGLKPLALLGGCSAEDLWPCIGLSLPGWLALMLAPRWRYTKYVSLSGPFFFAAVHALSTVSLIAFPGAAASTAGPPPDLDFSSLRGIVTQFQDPNNVFVGWIHFIVYDALVGRWMTFDSLERTGPNFSYVKHLTIMVPVLLLSVLFGPMGWLLYMTIVRPFLLPPPPTTVVTTTNAEAANE